MPVLFLTGLSGAFFRPMVLSYSLAVFISMIVAMTVTPAMCLALMGTRGLSAKPSPLLVFLKKYYGKALASTIKRPAPAIATALVLTLAGVLVYPTFGTELLPKFKERDFLVGWAHRAVVLDHRGEEGRRVGLHRDGQDPRGPRLRRPHRPGAAR